MERAFETVLVEQCAPALAGLKPSNLFRLEARDRKALYATVEKWQAALHCRGVTIRVLKECRATHCYLIYVYRESRLAQILKTPEIRRYLVQEGYAPADGCEGWLDQLAVRLQQQDFPHEIGVFLGYPLEDVIGFVENKGQNYTCCGYWKAYGDPAQAQSLFDRYKKCTDVYLRLFHSGTPITRLTVAV